MVRSYNTNCSYIKSKNENELLTCRVLTNSGLVIAIYIAPVATKLPEQVDSVRAIVGAGLEGDRYCSGQGTWSHWPGGGRQITLIEEEVLAALEKSPGLTGAQARRNIVTSGVRLDELIGFEFRVGEVVLTGLRQCEPCAHLENLTSRGVAAALEGRGGLRADIVRGGVIRPGDKIVVSDKVAALV